MNEEIASSWPLIDLRSVTLKIGSGATPRGGKESYKDDGITLIRSLNVYDFKFERDGLAYIDDVQAKDLSNVEVKQHDILLNITGASVARCCMVPSETLPARVNQHVALVRANKIFVNPYYLLYTINSPQYKHRLLTLAQGGATREALTKETIENFKIPVPPLPIQHKIAAILSAYDDLIENNTRRIAILEEMAQSLYREWFVHFRFPGHEKKSMVESALGMIPAGWEVVRLGELCFITMGQSPSSEFYNTEENGLPFHQGVSDFGERFPKDRVYCTVANRIAEAGDILFSVRAPVGRINLTNKKIVIGRGVCAIHSKADNQCFVFQQLKELFQEEDTIGNGAIFKAVTKEDMHGIKMIRPPQPIILSFEHQIQPIFSNLEILIRKNANLRKTRDLLLPKLISGEVDVEGLEIAGVEEAGEVETKAVGV